MAILIDQPELEALIAKRMGSGSFASVEDFLFETLNFASKREESMNKRKGLSGADIIAVMQACPDKDFEFGLPRPHMNDERDVTL